MKKIVAILGLLLAVGLPAFAQLPASAHKEAMTSASLTVLAEYPQSEPGVEVVKPIVPYLDKDVEATATDTKFWDQIRKIYPAIWDVLTPCTRAVAAANNGKAGAAILSLTIVLANLRGDVLAWLVKELSSQNERLKKSVNDYVAQNQRYLEAQQKYVHDLEQYATQVQQRQSFFETLALLRALSPPAAPRVYFQQAPRAPTINLGVHCAVEPTVLGQTFVNCY